MKFKLDWFCIVLMIIGIYKQNNTWIWVAIIIYCFIILITLIAVSLGNLALKFTNKYMYLCKRCQEKFREEYK